MTDQRINIKTLQPDELLSQIIARGMKKYRAGQILVWIYRHYADSFDRMTNIAKADREELAARFTLPAPRVIRTEVSTDGTRKFLFALTDGHTIESVLIPDEDRQTLCISSQVGCQRTAFW